MAGAVGVGVDMTISDAGDDAREVQLVSSHQGSQERSPQWAPCHARSAPHFRIIGDLQAWHTPARSDAASQRRPFTSASSMSTNSKFAPRKCHHWQLTGAILKRAPMAAGLTCAVFILRGQLSRLLLLLSRERARRFGVGTRDHRSRMAMYGR